jgi:hypothetical protein
MFKKRARPAEGLRSAATSAEGDGAEEAVVVPAAAVRLSGIVSSNTKAKSRGTYLFIHRNQYSDQLRTPIPLHSFKVPHIKIITHTSQTGNYFFFRSWIRNQQNRLLNIGNQDSNPRGKRTVDADINAIRNMFRCKNIGIARV